MVTHQLPSDTGRCQISGDNRQMSGEHDKKEHDKQHPSRAGGGDSKQCFVTRALDGVTGMTRLKRRV